MQKINLKNWILTLTVACSTAVSFGQSTHVEAKKLLADASAKLDSYSHLYMTFNYTFENKKVSPPIVQKESGTIAIKGDNYRLTFLGTEQIRNGNKLYTILMEDEEVQITDYDGEEDEGLTPSSILNLYKKGYSYKLGKVYKVNGKNIQEVVLKPNASEEIKKIEISIEVDSKKLVSLKQWGTNGTTTTFVINDFEPNKPLATNYFVFNKKNYPGFYIAD